MSKSAAVNTFILNETETGFKQIIFTFNNSL